MRSLGLTAALAAGVIALSGVAAPEVSAEPLRSSVAKKAVLTGGSAEDVARLSQAALSQAALVLNEGGDDRSKREHLARILKR